jgi:hypothetical protein
MGVLQSWPLSGPLVLNRAPVLQVGGDVRTRVDAIWAAALVERPALFDGPILTVVEHRGRRLTLAGTTYRYAMAARRDPWVREALKLRPLAVSGLLFCPAGLVFGRRARDVEQGAGLWELAPSGGVEAPADGVPDLADEILRELREEVGLWPEQVTVREPLGLIVDPESGTTDVVMPMTTEVSAATIETAHAGASLEYTALRILAPPYALPDGGRFPWRRPASS